MLSLSLSLLCFSKIYLHIFSNNHVFILNVIMYLCVFRQHIRIFSLRKHLFACILIYSWICNRLMSVDKRCIQTTWLDTFETQILFSGLSDNVREYRPRSFVSCSQYVYFELVLYFKISNILASNLHFHNDIYMKLLIEITQKAYWILTIS